MSTPEQESDDPSDQPKGTGSLIAACVVGALFAVVLAASLRLHAWWWQ